MHTVLGKQLIFIQSAAEIFSLSLFFVVEGNYELSTTYMRDHRLILNLKEHLSFILVFVTAWHFFRDPFLGWRGQTTVLL